MGSARFPRATELMDGDGVVDINDFNAVRMRIGSRL
jgi:hypothetical protein